MWIGVPVWKYHIHVVRPHTMLPRKLMLWFPLVSYAGSNNGSLWAVVHAAVSLHRL